MLSCFSSKSLVLVISIGVCFVSGYNLSTAADYPVDNSMINVSSCKSVSVLMSQNFDGDGASNYNASPVYKSQEQGNGNIVSSYDIDKGTNVITKDATTGMGKFLANYTGAGIYEYNVGDTVWSPSLVLSTVPNSVIKLQFKLANSINRSNARIKPVFNSFVPEVYATASGIDNWNSFVFGWQNDSSTTLNLKLTNLSDSFSGNDFGLDDIIITQYSNCGASSSSSSGVISSSSSISSSSKLTSSSALSSISSGSSISMSSSSVSSKSVSSESPKEQLTSSPTSSSLTSPTASSNSISSKSILSSSQNNLSSISVTLAGSSITSGVLGLSNITGGSKINEITFGSDDKKTPEVVATLSDSSQSSKIIESIFTIGDSSGSIEPFEARGKGMSLINVEGTLGSIVVNSAKGMLTRTGG